MRYLLVTSDLPPRHGGAARYHSAVLQALGENGAAYHVNLDRHWTRLLWEIPLALRRHDAGALIVGEVLPIGTAAWLLHSVGGPPYIIVCHGLDLASAARIPRKRWVASRVLRSARRIIVNSQATAERLPLFGIATERASIVHPPLGITPALALPAHVSNVRTEHDLAHARIILSVGRLIERKGFDTLIRAMAIVQQTHPRTVLVVIGDGPERVRLETLARQQRISVRFLGALEDATTAAWYAACDVFALLPRELPDGDVEGFGIVYLEAGAFGKPVIGARSGGVSEAVLNGETGLLIPPDDPDAAAEALARLLRDQELARRLGTVGRRRACEEFSHKLFSDRIYHALNE